MSLKKITAKLLVFLIVSILMLYTWPGKCIEKVNADGEWTFIANRGTASIVSAGTTLSLNPSEQITAGRVVIARAVSDNDSTATTNGQTSRHTISDSQNNTWFKVREQTFGGGSAGAGVTTSMWASQLTSAIGTGDTITLTLGSSVSAKSLSVDEFQLASGFGFEVAGTTGNQGTGTSSSTTLSGLTSGEYLWLSAIGIEGPGSDSFTQAANYTNLTSAGTTSETIASNVTIQGGYRIFSGTSDTYAPTLSNIGKLTYVSSGFSALSALTLPSFTPGDLAVAFAYRNGNNTPPSAAVGWTDIATSSGGNSNSRRTAYRVLQTGDLDVTFTNATAVQVIVLRGQAASPIGANSSGGANNINVTLPALTVTDTTGSAWLLGFAGSKGTNANTKDVAGMTTRSGSVGALGLHTKEENNSNFPATAYSSGVTTAGYRSDTQEVKAATVNRDWSAAYGALKSVPVSVISISLSSDGTINYGTLSSGETKTTVELSDTQVAVNDGNTNIDLNIKTSAPSGWSLGLSPGTDIFVHSYSTNSGAEWTALTTAENYQTLSTNLDPLGFVGFDMLFTAPNPSTSSTEKTITITIQAVLP